MPNEIIANILYYGSIGSLIFLAGLCLLAYTGIFAAIRNPEGKMKKELNWKSVLGFGIFIGLFTTLLYLGNKELIMILGSHPGWKILWVNSFGIFMVIHLFDLIVLDYLIVVKWHPAFLKLPNTAYYNSMKPHLEGFKRGLIFGLVFSFLVALIS